MSPQPYRKTHVLTLAVTGIFLILFSILIAGLANVRGDHASNPSHPFQKTAQTVLGCLDFDTLLTTNYNQQLELGYATLSQITTRVPGQNQPLLNYEYNAVASEAYSLYTSSVSAHNCTPTVSAPTPVSPASPPDYTFNPASVNTDIPLTCNLTVALQYIDSYAQQYIRNIQNEQTSLVNFVSNFQPAPTSITLKITQGATSIQSNLYSASTNLVGVFNVDAGNIGC